MQLPDPEVQALEDLFRTIADHKFRDRIQVVLMAHRGRPRQTITADLGMASRSIPRWLNSYLERGRDGLHPKKAKEAPPKIPAALAETIRDGVQGGPAEQGLDRANWTHEELADHMLKEKDIRVSRPSMGRFLPRTGHPHRPPNLPLSAWRRRPTGSGEARPRGPRKKATAGEIVVLSQDEARFPMVPTLHATLGLKGHRHQVGTWDGKDLLDIFAVVNVITGAIRANILESPKGAKQKTGQRQTRRMHQAFADRLRTWRGTTGERSIRRWCC